MSKDFPRLMFGRKFGKSAHSDNLSSMQRERQSIWSTSSMPFLWNDLCFAFHGRANLRQDKALLNDVFKPDQFEGVIFTFNYRSGCHPKSEKLFFDDGGPLLVLYDAASSVSDAAIPIVAVIMGANLLKGWKRSGSLARVICGIRGVLFMVQPAIGIAIVRAAKHFGAVHLRSEDPLYWFVLLLQYALPPAMNIGTITQLFGAGESECCVVMQWTYAFASLSLTLWSTFFIWLVA